MDSESEYDRKFQKLSETYIPFLEEVIKTLKGLSLSRSQHHSKHLATLKKVQQLRELLFNKSRVNLHKICALEVLLAKMYKKLKQSLPPEPPQVIKTENGVLGLVSKIDKDETSNADTNIKDYVLDISRTDVKEEVGASKSDEPVSCPRKPDKVSQIDSETENPLEAAPRAAVNTNEEMSPQAGYGHCDLPYKSNRDEPAKSRYEKDDEKPRRDKISIQFMNPLGKDINYKNNAETRSLDIDSEFHMYAEQGEDSKVTTSNDIQIDDTDIENANEDIPDIGIQEPPNSDRNELHAAVSKPSKEHVPPEKNNREPFNKPPRPVDTISPTSSSDDEIKIPFLHQRPLTTEKPKENVDLQIEVLRDLQNDILENLRIPGIATKTPALHEPKTTKVQNSIKNILIKRVQEKSGSTTPVSNPRGLGQSDYSITATPPSGRTESSTTFNHQFKITDEQMGPSHQVGGSYSITTDNNSETSTTFNLQSNRGEYPNKPDDHSNRYDYSNTSLNLPVIPGQSIHNSNYAVSDTQPIEAPHDFPKLSVPTHIFELSQAMINSPEQSLSVPNETPKDPRPYRSKYFNDFYISSSSPREISGSQNYFKERERYHHKDDSRNRNSYDKLNSDCRSIPNFSFDDQIENANSANSINDDAKQLLNDQPKSLSPTSTRESSYQSLDKRLCEKNKRTKEDFNTIDNNLVEHFQENITKKQSEKKLKENTEDVPGNQKFDEKAENSRIEANEKVSASKNTSDKKVIFQNNVMVIINQTSDKTLVDNKKNKRFKTQDHEKSIKKPSEKKLKENTEDHKVNEKIEPLNVELRKVSATKSNSEISENNLMVEINQTSDKTLVENNKYKRLKTQEHENLIKKPSAKKLKENHKVSEKIEPLNVELKKVSATKSNSDKKETSQNNVLLQINQTSDKTLVENNKDKRFQNQQYEKSTKKICEKKLKENPKNITGNQKLDENEEAANIQTNKKGIPQKNVELDIKKTTEKTSVDNKIDKNKVKHSKNRKHGKASKKPSRNKLKENTANDITNTTPLILNVSNLHTNGKLDKSLSTKNDTNTQSINERGEPKKTNSESEKSSSKENNNKISTEILNEVLSSDITNVYIKNHSKRSNNLEPNFSSDNNSEINNDNNTHETAKDERDILKPSDSGYEYKTNDSMEITNSDSDRTLGCDKLEIMEKGNLSSTLTSSIECNNIGPENAKADNAKVQNRDKSINFFSFNESEVKTIISLIGDGAEEIKKKLEVMLGVISLNKDVSTGDVVDEEATYNSNEIETSKQITDIGQQDEENGISAEKFTECNDSASFNSDINAKSNSEITSSEDCYTDKHYCFLQNVTSYPCRLCVDLNEKIEDIVAHINKAHPESEIPLSRMHPRVAEEAINQSKEKHFPDLCSKRSKKYVCRFCYAKFVRKNKDQSAVELFFEHVIRMHTGEYHVKGHDKCRYNMKRQVLPENFKGQLIGYICEKCHFTQVSFENVRLHVSLHHKSDQNIIPINLAVMSAQEIEQSTIDDSQQSLRMENDEQDNVINSDELVISQRQLNKKLCFLDTAEYIETIFQDEAVIDTASNYKLPETNPTPVPSVNTSPVETTTDAPNQSNSSYHHFRSTEIDKKYYECCINGKRNHFTTTLKIKMKKHVQKDHNELWDGHCSVCEMIVAPPDRRHFTDYLDHFFELDHITDPAVEDQPPGTAAVEESVEQPAMPIMNVRYSSEQISFEEPLVTLDEADEKASSRECTSSQVTMPESYENFHAEVISKKHPTVLDDMMKKEKLVQVYKCCARYCSFTSDSAEDALLHASAHARVGGEGALGCAYCSYGCADDAIDLVMHVFKQHGGCAFACARCFYRAAAPQLVQAHAARAHPGEAAEVLGSTEATPGTSAEPSNSTMDRSQVVPKYVCPHGCKYRVFYARDILEHISKRHATETSHSCHVCKESMCSPSELVVHMKTHGMNEYQCAWCLHGADDATRLLEHAAAAHPSKQPAAYVRRTEDESDVFDADPPLVFFAVDVEIVTPSAKKSDPILEAKKAKNIQNIIEFANTIYESNASKSDTGLQEEPSIEEGTGGLSPMEISIPPYMAKEEWSELPTPKLQLLPEENAQSVDTQTLEVNGGVADSVVNEKSVPLKKRTVIGWDVGEPAAKKTRQGPDVEVPENEILSNLLKCTLCEFSTEVSAEMAEHSEWHALLPQVRITGRVLPKYVPKSKRYHCGAPGCSFFSHRSKLFKDHWAALHQHVDRFRCTHCGEAVSGTSGDLAESALCHLRSHGDELFACSDCPEYHFQKKVMEKHLEDSHSHARVIVVREIPTWSLTSSSASSGPGEHQEIQGPPPV